MQWALIFQFENGGWVRPVYMWWHSVQNLIDSDTESFTFQIFDFLHVRKNEFKNVSYQMLGLRNFTLALNSVCDSESTYQYLTI